MMQNPYGNVFQVFSCILSRTYLAQFHFHTKQNQMSQKAKTAGNVYLQ